MDFNPIYSPASSRDGDDADGVLHADPPPPMVAAPPVLRIAPAAAVGVAPLTPASVLQMVDIRLLLLA